MNAGPYSALIGQLDQNWRTNAPVFAVSITDQELDVEESHPIYAELVSLCSGRSASLPFFAKDNEVVWCTIAPDGDTLREAVASVHAWVIPSLGGERPGDGYFQPETAKGALASAVIAASPSGYYKWRCPRNLVNKVCDKFRLRRGLEAVRPARTRPPRPSLYEMRARFAATLLVGDRDGAEEIIQLLDSLQLETAINTQFMRIRMWHRFCELERIRNHPDLPHLLVQPLPPRVRGWIDEACGATSIAGPAAPDLPGSDPLPSASPPREPPGPVTPAINTWIDWFDAVKAGRKEVAEAFLTDPQPGDVLDFSSCRVEALCNCLDDLVLDDVLRLRERGLILAAIGELLERYVRETGFPRSNLAAFYLSLFRLWCLLHKGNSAGQEQGHVLLELASALCQLNQSPGEVCQTLEDWWKAKPAPSQLYFALDAIELLERELPDPKPAINLWIEAADVIKRAPDGLTTADRNLWRRVGNRLGFDETTISQYMPPEPPEENPVDPITAAGLQHVAIVCLREQQAKQAADEIRERSGARVTVVSDTTAGAQTAHACSADVVLFVWLASTHAVFRAFDNYDRQALCYVQGTGASSIVRSLERWTVSRSFR